MPRFLGEYECKLDAKGRILLPVGLKRQLHPDAQDRFVINRGFEECLVLYPLNEWEAITTEINRLNLYVKKNRDFIRYFYRGAMELRLDSHNRLLLPKPLLNYANIKRDLALFAYFNRIEVWSNKVYKSLLEDEPNDFIKLAEDVMGDKNSQEEDKQNE